MRGRKTNIADDGYSTGIAARVSGIQIRALQRWIDAGMVTPSIQHGIGKGHRDLFSFPDLVTLRVIGKLRAGGFTLAKIRKALAALEQLEGSRSLANRFLVSDGKDIFIKRGAEFMSLLGQPGQLVFAWVIGLGGIQQEVREALKRAA